MRQYLLALSRRPFFRNIATVVSGTAVAQAIAMAFSPLITRLYGPEAFGIQGVFMSIAGIFGAIAALTYPIAIVLPKSDADAAGLIRLSLYIGIVMSFLTTVGMYFFGLEILVLLNAKEISLFIYLIPVFMFVSVAVAVLGQWLIRKKSFTLIAKVTVWQALLANSIKAGLGIVHPTASALIITNTLSGLLSVAMMRVGIGNMRYTSQSQITPLVQGENILKLAKRYYDFPLLRAPQVLINVVSHSLPVIMLAIYFGPASVGFYVIAYSVVAMPVGLIGGSIMQVFYPRITEAINHGEDVKALIIKATKALALTGALPFIVVIAAGPTLFSFVFGSEWQVAGSYAQWLSIWLFFQFINKPAVSAIPALRLQRGLLIYELFSTSTKVLALYLGYVVFKSSIMAIALFSIFGVVAYTWLIIWVITHSGKLSIPGKKHD
jgi:O-antigen/teichoic acid export membrane protein